LNDKRLAWYFLASLFVFTKQNICKTHWISDAFLFYIESFFKIIRLNCEQFVNISKKLKLFSLQISIYYRTVFIFRNFLITQIRMIFGSKNKIF